MIQTTLDFLNNCYSIEEIDYELALTDAIDDGLFEDDDTAEQLTLILLAD